MCYAKQQSSSGNDILGVHQNLDLAKSAIKDISLAQLISLESSSHTPSLRMACADHMLYTWIRPPSLRMACADHMLYTWIRPMKAECVFYFTNHVH